MEIEHCIFPDNLYYDLDNLTWIRRLEADNAMLLGITSMFSALTGKISSITLKGINTEIKKGRSIGTIESSKYFGVIRSPLEGRIIAINDILFSKPKLANDSPYEAGWFAVLAPTSPPEDGDSMKNLKDLKSLPKDSEEIEALIRRLRIKCYSALPDFEMFEIGIECAATLSKLGELISSIDSGQVIHLVSDDPSADIEMTRWSEESGQELVETMKEDNLVHFIVRKVK